MAAQNLMKITHHGVKSPIDTKHDVRIEAQDKTTATQTTFNTKLSVSCLWEHNSYFPTSKSSKNICNTTIWSNAKSGKRILNAVLDLNDFSYYGLGYIAPVTSQTMGDDHAKNINKKTIGRQD